MSLSKNQNLSVSICALEIIPLADVASISRTTDKHHVTITLNSGKSMTKVYFTPGTAELSVKPKETDAGTIYEQMLKISYPGIDDSNLQSFDSLVDRPLLVVLYLSSDVKLLIGGNGNGAKLSVNSQISSKSSGSVLEISWASASPHYILSN